MAIDTARMNVLLYLRKMMLTDREDARHSVDRRQKCENGGILMLKRKKIVALLLSLSLLTTMFVGCGQNSSTPAGTEADTGVVTEALTDAETESETGPAAEAPKPNEAGPSANLSDNPYGLTDEVADGTILHCFSWSFKTIEESLEDIAMAGYSAIQTSPINACYDGGNAGMELYGEGKWYYHYQPTDWTIGNYQLGTRDEFISLCAKAEEYGIKVIVDVAPNHTTTAINAISDDLLNAVGGLDNLYHSNGMTEITDYTDNEQRTLWAVGGLYDVNTEDPAFQDYFIAFLNDCIAGGADGFRYDTAKHIGLPDDPQDDPELPNNFWERVTTEVDRADELFVYGEVLQDGGERIADYIAAVGGATASEYGSRIRNAFDYSLVYAGTLGDLAVGEVSGNVVTWVESHDNYTGDNSSGRSLNEDKVKLAYAIIAARGEGTPLFFSRPYGATTSNIWGTFNRIGMAGDDLYKDPIVAAANRFRNAMVGLEEKVYNPDDDTRNVLLIERGTKGLFLINVSGAEYTFDLAVGIEDGEYVNRADESEVFTVKNGILTGNVKSKGVAFLYNEGYLGLADAAAVKVADDTRGSFLGDSLEVTLVAENCVKSTYSIDGGEEIAFRDGDKVTVGEGLDFGEYTTLTLKGENAEGKTTCTSFVFKKQDPIAVGTKIYFEKPQGWDDTLYAYVYDESTYSTVKANKTWPGIEMTLEADGTYSYTFEEEWIAPLVIFTDGTRQSNGTLEPGAGVVADKVYTLDDF